MKLQSCWRFSLKHSLLDSPIFCCWTMSGRQKNNHPWDKTWSFWMLLFISKRVYVIEDKSLTLYFKAKPLENFRFTTCQDEVEGMKLVTCCKVHNVHSRNINKTRHIAFQHELAREIYAKHEWKIGVRQAKCVTTWQSTSRKQMTISLHAKRAGDEEATFCADTLTRNFFHFELARDLQL